MKVFSEGLEGLVLKDVNVCMRNNSFLVQTLWRLQLIIYYDFLGNYWSL